MASGTDLTAPFDDVNNEGYYIERNMNNFFGSSDSSERFTTFWAAIKDADNNKIGVIGL